MRRASLYMLFVAVLLTAVPCLGSASQSQAIFIQAISNASQINRGVSMTVSGRVFDAMNDSIGNAVISIQVNNPQGSSIHVAIAYTDLSGVFKDAFIIPSESARGNFTVFLAAQKPGYDTAHLTLMLTYSSPDFLLQTSASGLSLRQGQNSTLTVTVLSLGGFDRPVNLTTIGQPAGVRLRFSPSSTYPSGSVTLIVTVADTVPVDNYTLVVLAVSGSVTHEASLQLHVSPGPPRPNGGLIVIGIGVAVIILGAFILLLRHRRRGRLKERVLEDLIKGASADKGYVATARVIARLEELRAMGKVDEATYQSLKKEYEKRLERSK